MCETSAEMADVCAENDSEIVNGTTDPWPPVGGSTPYSSGIDSVGGTLDTNETDSTDFSQLQVTPVSEGTVESPTYETSVLVVGSPDGNVVASGSGISPTTLEDDKSMLETTQAPAAVPPKRGRKRTVMRRPKKRVATNMEEDEEDDDDDLLDISYSVTNSHRRRQRKPSSSNPPVYQSQISPDANGIKIRIKKSPTAEAKPKRKRKSKKAEESLAEARPIAPVVELPIEDEEPTVQSPWGDRIPRMILTQVFRIVTHTDGCLPFLIRMSRVCRLWREVSLTPSLWHTVDLSNRRVRDRYKSEASLAWLCQARLSCVRDLNLEGWNQALSPTTVSNLATACAPHLTKLGLAKCWKMTADGLKLIVEQCKKLAQLDLSGMSSVQTNARSAAAPAILCEIAALMSHRLTHLILANNCLAGVTQIVQALATHCPNLIVLDMSNLRWNTSNGVAVDIEGLQRGCSKMKVLRFTNSMIKLSSSSIKEQVASPGFPNLEEISIAIDDKIFPSLIDDASMERILKSSHKLRLLDVRGCNRISDSSLVRVPAWDLEHLFLAGCSATKSSRDGLELIIRKWRHSLVEVDLSWTSSGQALDLAIMALAEKGGDQESPLRTLDLHGSSVSFEAVRAVLSSCPKLSSLNLSSCRALPRGVKRLYMGASDVSQLRSSVSGGSYDSNEEDVASVEPVA